MPSRAKTMLVAVKFRKKPVENMLPIVLDLIKQSFVSLFSELGRSWIRGAIILETNTTRQSACHVHIFGDRSFDATGRRV